MHSLLDQPVQSIMTECPVHQ